MSAVPHRRVVALARYGMAAKATALRRHPEPRRLATLVATVRSLEAKAVDDALELFDVLMTNDLLARAARESRNEKLRRYPRLAKDAGKLAAAVGVLNDQAVGLAGRVLSGTPRDSLHMIDLIYSQDAGQRPDVIITDTGAYSDIVFALITLLGFDYRRNSPTCPTRSCGASTSARTTGR